MNEMNNYANRHLLTHMIEGGMQEGALQERRRRIDEFVEWLNANTRHIAWTAGDHEDPASSTYTFLNVVIEGRISFSGEEFGVRRALRVPDLHDNGYRVWQATDMVRALAARIFGPSG